MEIRRVVIGAELIEDPSISPTPSYRIIQTDGSEEILSAPIDGFTHQAGVEQELELGVERMADPPAGGSSLRYQLLRVIAKRYR